MGGGLQTVGNSGNVAGILKSCISFSFNLRVKKRWGIINIGERVRWAGPYGESCDIWVGGGEGGDGGEDIRRPSAESDEGDAGHAVGKS